AARVERADRLPRVQPADTDWQPPAGRRQPGPVLPQVEWSRRQMNVRMKDRYLSDVVPALRKEFGYKNIMAVPRLTKIVVHMGLGDGQQNAKKFDTRDA